VFSKPEPEPDRLNWNVLCPTDRLSIGPRVCSILAMERLVKLRDEQWLKLENLLPPATRTGGRNAKPHRPMVEAMLWVLRTGAPWRDLPSAYGPWQSVYTRFSRWKAQGVLAGMFEALASDQDSEGYHIDATSMRAHQDAAGARKKGGRKRSGARAEVPPPRSMPSLTPSEIRFGSPSRKDRPMR
jgi:transposase